MAQVGNMKMNSGYTIPQLGFGTWQSKAVGSAPGKPGEAANAVDHALQAGYRHIDCAMAYGNQAEVGATLTKWIEGGKVKREDIFITSKIWNVFHSYEKATEAIDSILKELNIEYMDLCLIHWPQGYDEKHGMFPKGPFKYYVISDKGVDQCMTPVVKGHHHAIDFDKDGVIMWGDSDFLDTWKAMQDAKAKGKIRSLGVSNFNSKQMQRIIDNGGKIDIAQNECNPFFTQTKLIQWCRERAIVFTAYSPLANPSNMFRTADHPMVFENDVLTAIAKQHSKTAAQICIRWGIQRGTVVIPKSFTASRIKENIDIDFKLSDEQMKQIDALNRDMRIISLDRDAKHKDFPFHEPY